MSEEIIDTVAEMPPAVQTIAWKSQNGVLYNHGAKQSESNGAREQEFGGRPLPPERGPMAAAFQTQIARCAAVAMLMSRCVSITCVVIVHCSARPAPDLASSCCRYASQSLGPGMNLPFAASDGFIIFRSSALLVFSSVSHAVKLQQVRLVSACGPCSEAGADVPLWLDPEDAAQAAAAAAAPTEEFAFAPEWLVSAWAERGSPGYWGTYPPQVWHSLSILLSCKTR